MSTALEQPPRKSNANEVSGQSTAGLDPRAVKRMQEREKLRVSRFDAVSAFLMSLLWLASTFVLLLTLTWLTHRIAVSPGHPLPIPEPAARGANAEGERHDFEPPAGEEIVELAEPAIQESLIAVSDAVSTVAASLVAPASDSTPTVAGARHGDKRPPGPEDEGEDVIPRYERWELRFSARSVNDYAQQLDFYEIELGVLGGGVQGIDYASHLAGTPQTRRGQSGDEQRLYFMWVDRSSPLFQYDRQLLQKAGISLGPGRELLKFIELELAAILANIEMQHARKNGYSSETEIQKTIFESRPLGSGYGFVVIDQRYRKARL